MTTTATTPESMNLVTTPCNEFEAQREALRCELEALITEAKERVEVFVKDNIYGDFRVCNFTPNNFNVALFDGDKPVFGAYFDVYIRKEWREKETHIDCNIGTAGSFRLGAGSDREKLYLAFAKFIVDVNEWGLGRYLIRVHEKADEIWGRFVSLCKENKKSYLDTGLL